MSVNRLLMINSTCGIGSTGRICVELAKEFEKKGYEVKIAYGRGKVPESCAACAIKIGTLLGQTMHGFRTRIMDKHGFGSKKATRDFLRWAESYNPNVLWLHNIHGYYINVELLFEWIKKQPNLQVKWTLHDCWAFTGHCAYFTMAKCEQWKTNCSRCPQKKHYPASIIKDNCKNNFERKRAAFTGVRNLTLITPSQWLADLVKLSFLAEYPIEVRYNTIDNSVFKPTQSAFKEKCGLLDKKIILGVANVWDERKGLQDFIKMAQILDDGYAVVLVGLSKKQLKGIPKSILGITRTSSAQELAEIYTAADVFVNATYEDNYPTVNLEAQACGTPVITYRTGGSVESVPPENVVEVGDLQAVVQKIKQRKFSL